MSVRAFVAAVLVVAGTAVGLVGTTSAGAATTLYYVAMGDSLGAGVGSSPNSNSYVNQIYQHELARFPGLVLQNFSCSGATSGSVINGPNCGGATTTQLARAEAFLSAHPGQIAFLTIDIGANDVDGCTNGTTINLTCVTNGLNAVTANLPQIVSRLNAAYPGLRGYGMNYYDPFLAAWLTGPSGQTLAQQSVALAGTLSGILTSAYTAAGFPTADVSAAFDTSNFSLTGTYNSQTLPQNVANICNWTHMCEAQDIHANNTGHALIAQTIEPLIDSIGTPDTAPVNPSAVPGNGKAKVSWTAPPAGTVTGYIVTPYLGSVALAARTFDTTATTHTINKLTNGQTYTFTVAAKSATATSPESVPTAPLVVGAPAAPTKVSAASGPTTTATGALTVSYRAGAKNGSAVTQFTATCTSSDGGTTQSGVHLGMPVAPIQVSGVTTGRTYSCSVTETNGRGTSVASIAATVVVGAPAAPRKPTTTSVGSGSSNVVFKTPADNGDAITGARATCASSNGGATQSNTAPTGPVTVSGLTVGMTYTCTVSAINGRGTGSPSPASKAFVA